MRFHVIGLPHTKTSKEYCACAYTQKVLNFCKMMNSLGHTVYHYGAESSVVECTEHVQIVSSEEQTKWFGEYDWHHLNFKLNWDPSEEYWQVTNRRAALEITKRHRSRDFVCIIGGSCQKLISDLVPNESTVVEYGVGYHGIFSKFRVFESYTHQSAVYGGISRDPDVSLFDVVIPNYYDVDDFPVSPSRKDYLLFVGRLIQRKGLGIAIETAKLTGIKLLVAGQGVATETPDAYITEDGQILPKSIVEYVGYADVAKRAKLMGSALALLAPTTYLEPFGGVAVEAQLCGTPAITTDFGGFTETVQHGYTGFRCHTLSQFVQAVHRRGELQPASVIHHLSCLKYSIYTIRNMYQEYFKMLFTLWDKGWYDLRTDEQLNWLK